MKKIVAQLDENGYVVGTAFADLSPLEPGVYMIPARCVDADAPSVPDGMRAKWDGEQFVFDPVPIEPAVPVDAPSLEIRKRDALQLVDAEHQAALLQLTGNPSDAERATWPIKVALAEAIKSGLPLRSDQLAFLQARGLTTPAAATAYATEVLTNNHRFTVLVAIADRVRSDAKTRIAAAQTEEQFAQAGIDNRAQKDAAIKQVTAQLK